MAWNAISIGESAGPAKSGGQVLTMKKHAVTIRGHRTSISLEPEFWAELKRLAAEQGRPVAVLIAEIDAGRGNRHGLSSAIRLHILKQLKK